MGWASLLEEGYSTGVCDGCPATGDIFWPVGSVDCCWRGLARGRVLNFIGDCVWSPVGSRPHLLLTANDALAEYAAKINFRARGWWEEHGDGRAWSEVVQEIPARYLHLTLTWLDRLTAELDEASWGRLCDEFTGRMSALPPCEVAVGEPMVRRHAVEVYVHPTPELLAVGAQARAAVRAVFGEDAAPEPPVGKLWRPHLSTLYGAAEFVDVGLEAALREGLSFAAGEHATVLRMPAEGILVDQDTFAVGGFWWDEETACRVPVGGVDQ